MNEYAGISTFLENCASCGACTSACPFLEKFGTPDTIISSMSEDVFLCANCKACDRLCPSGLRPSEALLNLKQVLIKTNNISDKIKNLIQSSRAFTMRGHRFPFAYYSSCEIAFWPGCSLAGTSPALVKKIISLLKSHYSKTGLALDCCFDPLFHHGDFDEVKSASERIKERLKRHGIKRLILGCTNCKKIFSFFMPEIETVHILEAIEDNGIPNPSLGFKDIYLHHPCPSFRFDNIRQRASTLISGITIISNQSTLPNCCGLGGGSYALSESLSNSFTHRVIENSKEKPIITYCMGCKNRFLKKGKEAYHILETITDVKPLKKPASGRQKWINRLFLATGQRLKNKRFLLGIGVIMAIIIATYLRKIGYISGESLLEFIKQYKLIAPALFIAIYAIGPSIFIPSLPLTLGAGFLWGPFWGVVFSIIGATIGASVPFLLSRYILGDAIRERFSYTRYKWLKDMVEKHGWKTVAFTRIVPIFPYPVLNYLFGITPIPFLHYVWSSFVFMLPACIAYVAFGSSMGELILKGNIKGLVTGILIATVALLLPFAFRSLFKKLQSDKNE